MDRKQSADGLRLSGRNSNGATVKEDAEQKTGREKESEPNREDEKTGRKLRRPFWLSSVKESHTHCEDQSRKKTTTEKEKDNIKVWVSLSWPAMVEFSLKWLIQFILCFSLFSGYKEGLWRINFCICLPLIFMARLQRRMTATSGVVLHS